MIEIAADKRIPLTFRYTAETGAQTYRTATPRFLHRLKSRELAVQADCHLRGETRHFALERMDCVRSDRGQVRDGSRLGQDWFNEERKCLAIHEIAAAYAVGEKVHSPRFGAFSIGDTGDMVMTAQALISHMRKLCETCPDTGFSEPFVSLRVAAGVALENAILTPCPAQRAALDEGSAHARLAWEMKARACLEQAEVVRAACQLPEIGIWVTGGTAPAWMILDDSRASRVMSCDEIEWPHSPGHGRAFAEAIYAGQLAVHREDVRSFQLSRNAGPARLCSVRQIGGSKRLRGRRVSDNGIM